MKYKSTFEMDKGSFPVLIVYQGKRYILRRTARGGVVLNKEVSDAEQKTDR